MSETDYDLWRNLIQNRLSENEFKAEMARIEADPQIKKHFETFNNSLEVIDYSIAENLRSRLRIELNAKNLKRKRFIKIILPGIILLLIGLIYLFFLNRSLDAFANAEFRQYVSVKSDMYSRSEEESIDFKFLEAHNRQDFQMMKKIFVEHDYHQKYESMGLMLAESHYRRGEYNELFNLLDKIKKYELRDKKKYPINQSHLAEAYYLFKTGNDNEFREKIEYLLDKSIDYKWRIEVEELSRLSKMPFSKSSL